MITCSVASSDPAYSSRSAYQRLDRLARGAIASLTASLPHPCIYNPYHSLTILLPFSWQLRHHSPLPASLPPSTVCARVVRAWRKGKIEPASQPASQFKPVSHQLPHLGTCSHHICLPSAPHLLFAGEWICPAVHTTPAVHTHLLFAGEWICPAAWLPTAGSPYSNYQSINTLPRGSGITDQTGGMPLDQQVS